MDTKIISDTKQEFMGQTYWRCGLYFQRYGKRLHRAVWEAHNGEIPEGWHVHHRDNDRSNNSIENLALMNGTAHLEYHSSMGDKLPRQRKHMASINNLAKAWHGTEEGWKWHSQHAKETAAKIMPREYVCTYCGVAFMSKGYGRKTGNRFCCPNHRAAYGRMLIYGQSRCGEIYREIGSLQHGSARNA
jgi:hypothetical protein